MKKKLTAIVYFISFSAFIFAKDVFLFEHEGKKFYSASRTTIYLSKRYALKVDDAIVTPYKYKELVYNKTSAGPIIIARTKGRKNFSIEHYTGGFFDGGSGWTFDFDWNESYNEFVILSIKDFKESASFKNHSICQLDPLKINLTDYYMKKYGQYFEAWNEIWEPGSIYFTADDYGRIFLPDGTEVLGNNRQKKFFNSIPYVIYPKELEDKFKKKYGLALPDGEILLDPIYDDIKNYPRENVYHTGLNLGVVYVHKDGKTGLYCLKQNEKEENRFVSKFKYDDIEDVRIINGKYYLVVKYRGNGEMYKKLVIANENQESDDEIVLDKAYHIFFPGPVEEKENVIGPYFYTIDEHLKNKKLHCIK